MAIRGDFVVIDDRSGGDDVGEGESAGWFKLQERCPDAHTRVERVGYLTP